MNVCVCMCCYFGGNRRQKQEEHEHEEEVHATCGNVLQGVNFVIPIQNNLRARGSYPAQFGTCHSAL